MGPNPFLVPGGRLRDVKAGLLNDLGRLRRTHHHFRKAFLTGVAVTDVLEPVGRVHSPVLRRSALYASARVLGHSGKLPRGKNLFHAQLALFASDLFVIAGTHAPDPVVAESPRGNMLS